MLSAKKLVDTYRYGSSRKNPDVLNDRRHTIQLDEEGDMVIPRTQRYSSHVGAKKSAMRTKNGWERKDFGENLQPLWRFIDRSVGRPWDAVYKDISKNTDKRSTVGAHTFQHLWGFVERHPIMVDGIPHAPPTRWQAQPIVYRGKFGFSKQFWVGKDGILRRGLKPQKSKYDLKQEEEALECKQSLIQVDQFNWLSRHPDTKIWILLTYQPQEWLTKKAIRFGQEKDWYNYPVEYERKVRLHQPVSPPNGLKWFPGEKALGGDYVLKKTRTASRKLLRKMKL